VPSRPEFPDYLDDYIDLFACYQYNKLSEPFDFRPGHAAFEEGVEKIALFVRVRVNDGGIQFFQCPHVAKQLPSGLWSSKVSGFEIFEHALTSLESQPDAPQSNDKIEAVPNECKETLPGGDNYINTPLKYGQVALIMSRRKQQVIPARKGKDSSSDL
jgi:hypothetical protein